ncbi:LysR family transcriptional regulator [Caballeronia novacaledonica]|uniref:LysR family transcriptional regulator n=1 Tax=Caballeronia novacaledonica TaxID=1544861 RepID=UPI001EE1CB5F|nr:LysR family transcriptional regulator [Caballeronia novacaledonica]GJH13232.1 LysR family transcriptional regulator [Caballeronia novacaledonica]
MDLKLLHAFVKLTETGHYGEAASKVFVTQSTLSKQMHALEKIVGGRLFERGRHGAKLTPLGQLLLQEARALLRLSDEIDTKMHRAITGVIGKLDIGFGVSALIIAPRLIAGFRETTPDSQITLNDLSSKEQHHRLLDGQLDLGFCREPEGVRELSFQRVIDERLALVVPRDVRISSQSQMSALNSLGFVALSQSRGPGLSSQIDRWCASAHFEPRIVQHADDILTIYSIVAAGLGAAFLPLHGVEALGSRTHQQPLYGPASKWSIGICWRSADSNPLLLRFIDYVSKHQ